MPLPPITVQLSKFEQLEIVRQEIEARETELKHIEKQIRDCMFELERQRYLQTIHPIFQQLAKPEQAAHRPQLHAGREAVAGAIQNMQAALAALEAETAGQNAPPSRNPGLQRPTGVGSGQQAAAAPRRAKFDSFDDFRAARGPGS
jgi:hypothetical protein